MTQIALDKGILERLMSSETATTSQSENTQDDQQIIKPGEVLLENITMPIVQVINIQNIATSAFLLKYNASTKSNNINNTDSSEIRTNKSDLNNSTSRSVSSSIMSSNSLKRKCDSNSVNASVGLEGSGSTEGSEVIEEEMKRPADRFLLILSDGEYYETRCLLLPNLNYLVNSSRLRKGSIVRLERYELNIIPNGKILVIDQLSVIKNTIKKQILLNNSSTASSSGGTSSSNKATSSEQNERKSIMNNNLAETLKSIGIIGSLKPTSNNAQIKQQLSKNVTNHKNTSNNNNNNNNIGKVEVGEPTLISKFNRRFRDQRAEFRQQYDKIEEKFKQILSNERRCLASDSGESCGSSDFEEEAEENNYSTDKNNNKGRVAEGEESEYEEKLDKLTETMDRKVITKLASTEATTGQLSDVIYESTEEADDSTMPLICKCKNCVDKNTLRLCYKMLDLSEKATRAQVNARYLSLMSSTCPFICEEKNPDFNIENPESDEETNCNLNKLIKDLTRDRLFTINDSDRAEIITKAYNVIIGTENEGSRLPGTSNGSAKIGDYLQYAWMRAANEFIHQQKYASLTNPLGHNPQDDGVDSALPDLPSNEIPASSTPSETSSSSSECNNPLHHHHHSYQTGQQMHRRRANRNPKTFYQQIKKNNKTQSLKAMRSKVVNQQKSGPVESAGMTEAVFGIKKPQEALVYGLTMTNVEPSVVPSKFPKLENLVQFSRMKKEALAQTSSTTTSATTSTTTSTTSSTVTNTESITNTTTATSTSTNTRKRSRSSSLSIKKPPPVIALPNVPFHHLLPHIDSMKQSFEQQIEKELEIHLDSINSFKEKLLNFTNEAKLVKQKISNEKSVTTEPTNVADTEPIESKRKEKNKKKKKKKLMLEAAAFQKQEGIVDGGGPVSSGTDSGSLKQLKLEQDLLERQLIEQQKLQQMQIEQLQRQIDEFVQAETKAANARQKARALGEVVSSGDGSTVANIGIISSGCGGKDTGTVSGKDLSVVLNNLSEALIKNNKLEQIRDQTKDTLNKLESIHMPSSLDEIIAAVDENLESATMASGADVSKNNEYLVMSKFEQNLKKIDSFQKIIYSQDLASISSLISSITKQTSNSCPSGHVVASSKSEEANECQQLDEGQQEDLGSTLLNMSQEKNMAKSTAKSILDRLDNLKEQKKFKFLVSQSNKCIEDEKCSCDGGGEEEDDHEEEDDGLDDEEDLDDNHDSDEDEDSEYDTDEEDDCDDEEGEDSDDTEDEEFNKDQLITIIMKQAKSGGNLAPELFSKQLQKSAQPAQGRLANRYVPASCFKKLQSMASRHGLRLSGNKMSELNNPGVECDDETGSDNSAELDEKEIESSFYKIFEGGNSSPLVEEFLKNIKEDDEDIEIFVESLSSLAKKSLYETEDKTEDKNKNLAIVNKPEVEEVEKVEKVEKVNEIIKAPVVQKTKAEKLNTLIKEFEKQQKEKMAKLGSVGVKGGVKKRPNEGGKLTLHYVPKADSNQTKPATTQENNTVDPLENSKLTKNQRKKLKKQAKKQQQAVSGTAKDSLPVTTENYDVDDVPDLEDVDDIVIDGPVISISLKNDSKVTTALMKKLNINPDSPPAIPKFLDRKGMKNMQPVLFAPLSSVKNLKEKDTVQTKTNTVLAKPIEVPAIAEGSTSSKAKSKKDKKKAKKAAEQQRAAALAAAEAKKKNQKGKADVVGAEMSKQSATKLDEFYSFDEEFSDSEQRDKQTKEQNINKCNATTKKTLNDISDFRDSDVDNTSEKKAENTHSKETIIKAVTSDPIVGDSSDDQGSWVKVASNGQHVQEKKKKSSLSLKNMPSTTASTTVLTSSSSSQTSVRSNRAKPSNLGLDDFFDDNIEGTSQTTTKDFVSAKLDIKNDLLIPSSIDEEELMLRKALELSLKETSMQQACTRDTSKSIEQAKTSKLGLDDFSDEKEIIHKNTSRIVKPTAMIKTVSAKSNPSKTNSSVIKSVVSNQKLAAKNLSSNKPIQVSTSGNSSPSRPISFAAVAAGSLKPKQSSSIPSSTAVRQQKQQAVSNQNFKWNNPSSSVKKDDQDDLVEKKEMLETTSDEQSTASLTLSSYLPANTHKCVIDTGSLSLTNSIDVFASGDTADLVDTSEYQPMKVYTSLFETSLSYESGDKQTEKTADYFSLTNMSSSLDEINPNCLLPRLSISSTSASLLSIPTPTTDQPMLSPVKNKPIGAERSNYSTRNSIISPKDILNVVSNNPTIKDKPTHSKILTPPPQASTNTYVYPQRPNSTNCITKPSSTTSEFVQPNKDTSKPVVQKQTIRVPPLLQDPVVQHPPQSITPNDQIQRLKQAQQFQLMQQQQQQQTLLNNLILLLSNNQASMDQQQMASLVMYANQLLTQINNTNNQLQTQFQGIGGEALLYNSEINNQFQNVDLLSVLNGSTNTSATQNQFAQNNNVSQQNQQQMLYSNPNLNTNIPKSSSTLWANNIAISPSPPPINNTNSSSSSIAMPSNSSTSSTPSPHLINPQTTINSQFSNYNYFSGNSVNNIIGGLKSQQQSQQFVQAPSSINSISNSLPVSNHYNPFASSLNTQPDLSMVFNSSSGYGAYSSLFTGSGGSLSNVLNGPLLPNPIGRTGSSSGFNGSGGSIGNDGTGFNRINNFD